MDMDIEIKKQLRFVIAIIATYARSAHSRTGRNDGFPSRCG